MYLLSLVSLGLLALSGVCHAVSSSSPSSSAGPTAETTQFVVTTTQTVVTTSQPKSNMVSYVVSDSNGTVCILLNSTIKFSLPYESSSNISLTEFYLPSGGSVSGSSCNSTAQELKVTNFHDDWVFYVLFERKDNQFAATKLLLNYKVTASPLFPNATRTGYGTNVTFNGTVDSSLFGSASIPGYYLCNAESTKPLKSTLGATGAQVTFSQLTVFAFGTKNSADLDGTKTQCSADAPAPDYLVPIIVGCALAGIILIVLIAYIIGRYRSRSTYQTV